MGVKNKVPFLEIKFTFLLDFFRAKMLATNLCLCTFGRIFFFTFLPQDVGFFMVPGVSFETHAFNVTALF